MNRRNFIAALAALPLAAQIAKSSPAGAPEISTRPGFKPLCLLGHIPLHEVNEFYGATEDWTVMQWVGDWDVSQLVRLMEADLQWRIYLLAHKVDVKKVTQHGFKTTYRLPVMRLKNQYGWSLRFDAKNEPIDPLVTQATTTEPVSVPNPEWERAPTEVELCGSELSQCAYFVRYGERRIGVKFKNQGARFYAMRNQL